MYPATIAGVEQSLLVSFIDFEKAFDSFDNLEASSREWWSTFIKLSYKGTTSRVLYRVKASKEF